MSAGSPLSPYDKLPQLRPPGQSANRVVVMGVVLLLLLIIGGLWFYLYVKSREKPYFELQGFRVASESTFNQFLRQRDHRARYRELGGYLQQAGVGDVTEVVNLLRQGSDWLDINEPAFAIPPRESWDNIVATLILVRDELEPAIGPVDILSAYRTDNYNRKAGGAQGSKHRNFCGLDVVPRSNIGRKELAEELRTLHARLGPESKLGLGLYSDVRFHVDTCGYRRW